MPPSPRGEGFCAQPVSTGAKTGRMTPLPSSGLRETPDATLPSRGGILRAARSDGRENGTSSTPKSFPSRGRCRRRRRKRCRIGSQPVPTDAKAEQVPLPVLPLEGKVSPQATEEVSYRKAASFDECKSGTKITSSVIRLAGDAGCHPPLKGRDSARSPLRRAQERNENHLFRHPACGGRRMPPSPRGEGFCAQPVSTGAKTGRVPLPSPSP